MSVIHDGGTRLALGDRLSRLERQLGLEEDVVREGAELSLRERVQRVESMLDRATATHPSIHRLFLAYDKAYTIPGIASPSVPELPLTGAKARRSLLLASAPHIHALHSATKAALRDAPSVLHSKHIESVVRQRERLLRLEREFGDLGAAADAISHSVQQSEAAQSAIVSSLSAAVARYKEAKGSGGGGEM